MALVIPFWAQLNCADGGDGDEQEGAIGSYLGRMGKNNTTPEWQLRAEEYRCGVEVNFKTAKSLSLVIG